VTSTNVRELALRLQRMKQTQAATTSVPQLASSSVEAGSVDHYDETGQLTARVGQQHDGTTAAATLTGPTPPAPLGVDADGGQLTVTARWDGTFLDGEVAPMDFARVEVHRGTSQDFVPDPLPTSSTRVGSIEHAGGGSFTWTEQPGEVWVTMITRSASGKASEPIARVMVEVSAAVDPEVFEQLKVDLAESAQRIDTAMTGIDAAQAAADAAALEAKEGKIDGARVIDATLVADRVIVPGSVGAVSIADGAVTARTVETDSVAAKLAAVMRLDVAQLFASDAKIGDAVIEKLTAQILAAHKITADDIDADKIAAALATIQTVKAENIQSGFLNASIGIGTTGAIMAGDWSKSYARIDDKGFSTYTVAEDGTQYMATSLGSAATNSLTIADSAGVTRASITPDGDVAANSVTVADDVSIAGADLIGQRLAYAGSSGASWLDTLPWALAGISNMGKTVAGRSVTAAASEVVTPLQVVTATVWPGRTYQVTMPYAYYAGGTSSTALAYMGVRAYYTVGSQAAPTPADPVASGTGVGYSIRVHSAGGGPISDNLVFTVTPNVDAGGPVQMKVMVASSVKNATMAYSVPAAGSWLLTVQDIGPSVPDTGYPAGGKAVSQFVSTWRASSSRSYDKNGADSYADYQQGILRHGGDALTHSAFVCNDPAFFGEKGKTIAQALTGATVTKVEIGVASLYWANATGGTLTLLPLGATSIPATDTSPGDPKKGVEKKFTTRSQWQWVTVPTSWITPTSTGVRLGPTWFYGTANQGYFANHKNTSAPPQIRITYTRADKG